MTSHLKSQITGVLVLGALFGLAACQDNVSPDTERAKPSLAQAGSRGHRALLAINRALAARDSKIRVPYIDYVTNGASGQVGQRIFAFDRGNKQIGIDWVPGDPRRGGGTNITYLVDRSDASPDGLTASQVDAAIDRAMNTWEAIRCSKLSIDPVTDPGTDPDLFDGLVGFGGVGTPLADITHAGWYPAAFFELVFGPGSSEFVLAFTAPFIFVDDDGNPTDINNDRNLDYALAEIYYNDGFAWGINTDFEPLIDVETVALHESGHGLSQGHFGKIFQTVANGKVHFAPFAIMNALLSRQAHELTGTDIGGHCSIWANWPHK